MLWVEIGVLLAFAAILVWMDRDVGRNNRWTKGDRATWALHDIAAKRHKQSKDCLCRACQED